MISLFLLPPPLTNSTAGCGLGQLLTFILSPLLLLFLRTLSSPISALSPPSVSCFTFVILLYIHSFSLHLLSLGHIHLLIVMIAASSSAVACRKSELVHVSEHRYALWTPAGWFSDCWSEKQTLCVQHGLQDNRPRGNDAENGVLQLEK